MYFTSPTDITCFATKPTRFPMRNCIVINDPSGNLKPLPTGIDGIVLYPRRP